MTCLPGLNGCQSYPAEYSCWDNLILLLQISYENPYPYLWHLLCQHCTNMHTKVSFHQMCATKYVWLVLPVPSLNMQIFVFPILLGVHTLPWTIFFCLVMRNFFVTADNRSYLLVLMGRGERKPQVWSVWNTWHHSPKNVEFFVVGPVALVQYIPQCAKDNKMQSFPSITPPADLLSSLSYVPIFTASPES